MQEGMRLASQRLCRCMKVNRGIPPPAGAHSAVCFEGEMSICACPDPWQHKTANYFNCSRKCIKKMIPCLRLYANAPSQEEIIWPWQLGWVEEGVLNRALFPGIGSAAKQCVLR